MAKVYENTMTEKYYDYLCHYFDKIGKDFLILKFLNVLCYLLDNNLLTDIQKESIERIVGEDIDERRYNENKEQRFCHGYEIYQSRKNK